MPSAKPLGFYGLDFETEIETAIDALGIDQLVALTSITADEIYDLYEEFREDCVDTAVLTAVDELSLPQKLALIRAVCDRIEIKLMQVAT